MTNPPKFNIFKLVKKPEENILISFIESSLLIKQRFPIIKTKLELKFLKNANNDLKMFVIKVIKKVNNKYWIMDASMVKNMYCEEKLQIDQKYVIYGVLENDEIICKGYKKANFYELCNGLFKP